MMSRSKCDKNLYKSFLEATAIRYSGLALSEVSPKEISHDSISRWLSNKNFRPSEIYKETRRQIREDVGGVLAIDDMPIEKPRSKKIELVKAQYSGSSHKVVPSMSIVNAVYIQEGNTIPIDFRVYAKEEDGKTKNKHFTDMVKLSVKRGIKIECVVADSWYSSLKNLKVIRDMNLKWVMGLRKNRRVNKKQRLEDIKIEENGTRVHLQGYGWITVFRIDGKNGITKYFGTNIPDASFEDIKRYVSDSYRSLS